ncbi:YopT-type cysteine protease domain-containing protein [Pasteurella oralis]|uniref:YopT-type cysteine protease domain-containing protein n=1 Tax=Pasteurella oralis TaxID=1071947 RepID=A0ABW4NX54_9PAST
MNKNRYKLIFSKSKSCLVPVAECIKSAMGNGSSDSVSESESSESEEPPLLEGHALSPVSLLIKTTLNPVSSMMQLNWKQFSILLLTVVSVPTIAQEQSTDINSKVQLTQINNGENTNIKLSSDNTGENKTKLYQTENKVIVIDIAKPNDKGISDNRFEKFNISNGGVFNNSKSEKKSQLVGYVPGNKNLADAQAKVILNQVKGSDISKIEGALEILGQKADLVIANPNGITLNGVQTINADRFVATTSETINPSNPVLKINKGTVTIDVDGFATDGLQYLDIIAKKIEQKNVVANKNKNGPSITHINFIAGKSEYDLSTHKLKEDSKGEDHSDGIAITGASTGAMHGASINLVVTDKGAGVKHDGLILSEKDVHIEIHDGDLELGNTQQNTLIDEDRKIHAKGKFKVKNSKRTIIGSEIKANEIDVKAQETTLRKEAKVSAKKTNIDSSKSLIVEENAKLIAPEIDVKTDTLKNEGRIYGRDVDIDANNLVNNKEIHSEEKLKIQTKGKQFSVFEENRHANASLKEEASLKTSFINKGAIESSGDAELTFKDNTSFITKDNKFIKAKNNLTINAANVEIDKTQNIQLSSNVTIKTKESFINHGTLASAQALNITAEQGNIYNIDGVLGAAKSLKLTASTKDSRNGNIINQADALLHSEGEIILDADRTVYNLGSIFSKNKLMVNANELINDVKLSGKVDFKELSTSRRYELSEIARHGWHNNYYQLNLDIQELDKSTVTIDKMGSIRSDSDFEFKAKVLKDNPVNSKETASKLVNHGLINIKGTFKSDAAQLINQMKYFEQNALEGVFKNKANINIYYKPSARFILTPLSGQAHRKFESLESFLDALFGPSPITKSGIYSAENFSAYKLLSHVKHSPMFQKSMAQVFGAEWHRLSYDDMSKRWKEFKEKPTSFIYYPEEKAKILAGKLEANGTTLQNGEYSQYDTFDGSINIGKHALTLPKVEFRPEISSKEIFDQGLVDLSALADILDPNLFIDNSVQLEKQGIDINKEDLDLIDKKEIDYLDPDEIVNNGRLLDELLTDLGEDEYIDDDKFYDNRRKNNERFESLPRDLQHKLHELFAKRKEERNAKRLELLEKARIAKEKEQKERNENYKEEEKRLEIDKSIKEKELADQVNKERLIREIEAKREVEIAQKEARKKEELRLAEEKRKQEQAKKAEEKKVEEERIEEEKQLSKEQFRQEEDISKKILLKAVDDNRPKVETDPLYRTKLKYINQDEYVGANHFFNNITTDAIQNSPDTKVSVLGDNYFEHQLITRTIEKKVDNQLEQKYKASGVELVKKLMENSTSEAKELGLKVGEVLTKEQQAKLKQDIVWYVKTKINGKDVFVPQVYFAPQTLANAEKAKGLGTAVINASELNIKAENVVNSGTLSGDKIKVEASEKIQNKGSIISTEETRLVGRKGIENLSRSFANNELGVDVQRSKIKTDGHLHLETDLDAKVDVQASDIKAKTGFVKTGELNLKDTYQTKHSYDAKFSNESSFSKKLKDAPLATILNPVELLSSALNFSSKSHSESHHQANSVGSKVSIDQLHVAVEKDVNQVGSELEAKRISGVIKGNYNTEAGKNVKNSEREEYSSHFYASAHASGGGTSVRVDYNSIDGGKASVDVPTTQTGVGADAGLSFNYKKQSETLLTHNNSELQVESGTLHVLGNADIGGVDINNKLPQRTAEKAGTDPVANNTNTANTPAEQSTTASNNKEKSKFNTLSEAEINDLMSEKGKAYFDEQSKTPSTSGFELSAKEIKSTKQKDEYTLESTKNTFKIGPEAEAHSAIADMVSHMVKEFRDVQNGVKQDGTVALQHASDVLNLVTGDLVGTSAKLAVENTRETKSTQETGDIVTKIGGNVTLSARNGSLELKNIQSNADTNLTLKAKENVDILAGEKTRNTTERLSRQKLAAGANAGCSAMTGTCTAGVSASIEGNESFTSEHAKTQNNSLLQGQNITIDAGKDLNLVNSNIEANNVDLSVKGNTNIVSKQDTLDKTTHGFDYNVSAGAALSSATIATPTGIIGGGYTNESEHSATVNQQAGIKANKLTGSVNNLNLEAGYIVNNDKSGGFKVTGEVTSKELHDRHDKDGGSFGLSVGINERGTSAFNVRGGRSDQKHYNATQQSTLTGVTVEQSKVSGIVNDDLGKAKNVTRDDTYASTQFSFEVADIVELGKKAKDKIDSHKNKGISDDTPNVSLSKSRLSESDSDSVSVKNPIYDSIEAPTTKVHTSDTDSVTTAPNTRSLKTEDMVDNPLYSSTVATPRSAKPSETVDGPNTKTRVYEEIPLTTSEVTSNQTASTNRTKTVDSGEEHVYAEVGQGTYSTLGDKNANGGRGLRKANDTEGTYNKLGDSVADTTRAKAKVNEEHIYAEVGQGTYSTLGDKSANGGRGFKQVDSVEGIYNTVGDNHSDIVRRNLNNAPEYSESMPKTRRNAQDSLPEVPTTKSRTNLTEASDGIYSEITLKPRSANDPLPDLPKDAQSRVRNDVDFAEHIYEDIGTSRAKRSLPNTPEVKAKAPVSDSDGQYASVNITPRARNPQDVLPEAPNTRAKVVVENDGIYSQINDVVTPQPRSKSIKVESDYEAIPLGDFEPKVEQPRSRSRHSIIEETVQVEPKVRSISEEIPSSNSTNKAKAPVAENVYATLDKTAEGRARANAKADEAVAQNIVNKAKVDDDVPPTLPKRPDNLAVEVESHSATNTGKVIRPENEVAVQSELRNRVNTDGDYAEVVDTKPNPKANRPLPDAPTTQNVAKNRINTDGDYAQIVETAATQSNSKAKRDLPELPNDALAKTRPTFEVEGDYAQIGNNIVNRAPRSQQENNAESVKNLVITEANSNNNSNNQGKKAQAAEIAQATGTAEKSDKSWFSKVKDFFTGGSSKEQAKGKVSKATKVEEQDAQVAAKPRYDDLEDNINLKNLLALEAQRNEAFETNVLKNTKFLDEAREAAKKSIPEATIKQMGNSPEFDDILTDGARKVEKRINDAVTFKPSAEEFSAIQGLVKTLPKGEVIDDVTIKTQSITEALAETSKTIQRNPKLKEEVQGAIEEFLKSSQGKDLTVEMVEKLNHGLRPDEGSDRQLYKKETLTKENAVFSSPEASKIQLIETIDFINRARKQGVEPSVLAGLVYQRLIAYHPFAEGNGRMARVIVNKLLLDAGYPPFTKFNSDFETQIIPQTLKSAKSATSTEVVKEFLTELSKKPLPEISKTVTDKAKIAVEEPIYATVDKRPEALAKAKARGDEAAAKNANVKATVETDIAPALPARPSELTSTIDNTTKTGKPIVLPKPKLNTSVESENQVNAVTPKAPAKEKPPVAPKPKVKVIVENDADGVARTRVIVQPEVAGESQLRSRTIGNSDYAEIVDGAAQVQPRSKARQSVNSDYAEIIDGIPQIQSPGSVKARSAEDTAIPSNRIKMDDGLYATIDKSPEALARAKARGDEAVAAQSTLRKTQVEDEAPALPKRSTDLVADATDKQVVLEPKFRSLAVEFDDVNVTQPQAKAKPVSDRIQQKELVEQSRGVLKQVQDQFQPLKVKNKIDAVRSSVEEYGGEVSFKFAQSKGEVYKEIVKHLETQNGVCESTCAHWIAKKVDPQDDNFWTSLYEGGQKGHLKKETIDSIKKLQTEFINSGSATQQFKLTDSWLQEQGVVPKEKRSGNLSRRDEVAGTVSKNDVSALTKAILDTGNETSGVKKISINLEGGSHTVSAAIQGQKVVFFDPNFGEMTFPSRQKFETWLKEAFWNKSGYAGKNEGKRFFNVVNYELPTKAATNNSANVEPVSGVSDVNFKTKTQSNSQDNMADTTTQIRRDQVSGESYITQNDVVTAITNTNYIPKPVTDAKEQFEKAKQKARSVDNTKEAEKKLALIAKEAKNLPKEHLLKATKELVNGISMDDIHAIRQEHKPGAKVVMPSVISEFEGKNVQSMGKIMKNLPFDESYVDTRKQINEKIVEKLDSNKEFHDLMNQKLSGNEAGIRKLFDIVESAKRESLKEVTGIDGKKATLELDTQHGALSLKQGYYANDEVHMNATPLASLFRTKKQNNKEILDTIVHELTHHDQAQIANNRYGKIADAIKPDADLLSLNQKYYIDSDASSFSNYKKQPLEREAFTSGHELSNQLSKLVERGYTGKVQEIQTIEHLPNKLNNLESPRNAQVDLGENALIYGLKHGRKELIAKANAADAEGKNAILADSYIGKLNLGFEFAQLSSFAKQVKSGNVTEQDIQDIASFNDPGAKFARKDDSRHRINDANIEDNQRIIKELIKNENAVDALKRIAILSDQEQDMYNALRKNEKFDMEELQESANYTTAENSAIREFKKTQDALNEARMDFFAEKTKLIAKETLERGGQLYFALDGLATDTPNFRNNTKIDLNRLKEVFDPNNPHYDSVTSRELRYLYENYKDHPNLKFTIKDHVIENPLKTLDISSVNGQPSTGEQNVAFNKQLFANPFKAFKQKEKVQGPKIEHLGGNADKDAFYFPLDKIVTKDRGISKDMKVNMENIKKAFNPKDKHYNSTEAKNLRALYEQDPTMSSTRFVIGNQVIENPFKSAELQDYIQKHHVKVPVVTAQKAKPLPEVPTEATVNKASALKQPNTAARKPAQQAKPRAQADPNAIYAQVNKNRVTALDKVDGFYSESQLKTRTDKIVEQVSHVPTTEPTYADLQFSKPARSKHRASDEVVYEEVATKVKGKTPETLAKPQKPKQQLNKGIIPESQLKTRSDKVVEQVSRVPTTEPVYADLQFPASGMQTKQVISSSEETIYAEVGKKSQEEPIYQNVIRKGAK